MVIGLSNLTLKMLLSSSLMFIVFYLDAPLIVNADIFDELQTATRLTSENIRSTHRLTEFANACTSLIKSGDYSMITTCDSVTQKFNIEMGHFYKDNQLAVESLIYPYTIPTHAESTTAQDSSNVVGSNDTAELTKHNDILVEYGDTMRKILDECVSFASQQNIEGLGKCIDITKSFNSKIHNFNTNAGLEINKVLDLAKSQGIQTDTSDIDLP